MALFNRYFGWAWMAGGVPAMWKPLAFVDLVFAALFAWALMGLGRAARAARAAAVSLRAGS